MIQNFEEIFARVQGLVAQELSKWAVFTKPLQEYEPFLVDVLVPDFAVEVDIAETPVDLVEWVHDVCVFGYSEDGLAEVRPKSKT